MNRKLKWHVVKTNRPIFPTVWNGQKCSELRRDDRDYRIGDVLVQGEWGPNIRRFTGRVVMGQISAMTRVSHWVENAETDWVILHLDPRTLSRRQALLSQDGKAILVLLPMGKKLLTGEETFFGEKIFMKDEKTSCEEKEAPVPQKATRIEGLNPSDAQP